VSSSGRKYQRSLSLNQKIVATIMLIDLDHSFPAVDTNLEVVVSL
jgi:hypothetical protein